MVSLPELWLPILLSAVAVFFASFLINAVLPYHRTDHAPVPDEEGFLATMRAANLPPGDYMFPRPNTPKEMSSPEYQARLKQGPVGILTMMPPGGHSMGKSLGIWFGQCLFVGIIAAYLASRTLEPTTDYIMVFRVTGTVAFASYSIGLWQSSIWFGRKWSATLKYTFDGLVYALLTGGIFGWLWP